MDEVLKIYNELNTQGQALVVAAVWAIHKNKKNRKNFESKIARFNRETDEVIAMVNRAYA